MILNRYAQNARILKRIIPITLARSQFVNLRLFCSFGDHIARNKLDIHIIENTKTVIQKLPLISFLRRSLISSGLIPNMLTKKAAWSGLKTTYARKLQKNITAIRRSVPINLNTVHTVRGSRLLFFVIISVQEDKG